MGALHQQASQLQKAHIHNCRPALRLLGFDEESLEEQEVLFAADIKNFLDRITIDPFDFRDERSEFSQSRLAIQVKDYMTAASFEALRDICHTSRHGGYKYGRSRRPSQTTEFQEHLLIQELKVVFWKYITAQVGTPITSAVSYVHTPSISARTTLRSQPPPMAIMTNSRARSSKNSATSPSTPQQSIHFDRPIKTSCPNSAEKPISRSIHRLNSPIQQTDSILHQTPSSPTLPSPTTVPCIVPQSSPPPLLSQSAKTSSTSTSKAPPIYIMVILPTHTTSDCQTPSPKILPYLNPSLWKCSSVSLFAHLTTTFASQLVPQELAQPSLLEPDSLSTSPGLTTSSRQTMINSSPDRITSLQICVRHRNRRKNSPLWLIDVEDEIQWIVARQEILDFMKWDLKAWRARSSAETSSARAELTKGSKDSRLSAAGAREGPYRCWISIEVFTGSAEAEESRSDVYTKETKGKLAEVVQDIDMDVDGKSEIEDFDVDHLNCLVWKG